LHLKKVDIEEALLSKIKPEWRIWRIWTGEASALGGFCKFRLGYFIGSCYAVLSKRKESWTLWASSGGCEYGSSIHFHKSL
jgi:hypothetical protein